MESDAGRELLRSSLAVARYDSQDGYGSHQREAAYVLFDSLHVGPPFRRCRGVAMPA